MKMRIMGLLCAMVMLLTLLPGCSGAEAEPEAATVAATQVSVTESATEPAAEPTTEPATVPTKPPTIVEELGYELWDGAENITQFNSWNYRGAEMPVSARVNGSYRDIMMQFAIVGSDGKEYRALADTTVDIWMSEFPGSGFDDDIDWLEEKLTPFYEACKKRESSKLTYEEWIEANSDQKLIYVETAYRIKGTELYLKTIEDGVKMKDLRVGYTIPDIVDSMTGEVFFVKEKYDHQKPEVGCWQIDQDGDEVEIQAWYTCRYAWNVTEGSEAEFTYTNEHYILVPADYDHICICMGEYATSEKISRLIRDDSSKSTWGRGSIFDEEFIACEAFKFHFFGLDV